MVISRIGTALAAAVDRDRRAAHVSVAALAAATAISRPTLNRRLAGSSFTVDELVAVGNVLDRDVKEWLTEAEKVAS